MTQQIVVGTDRPVERWCHERGLSPRGEVIGLHSRHSAGMLRGLRWADNVQVTQLETPEHRSVTEELHALLRRYRPERRRGVFVAFEGGEGAGKSTQLKLLSDTLWRAGLDVVMSREPGGTRLGHLLRSMLLDVNYGVDPDARTEALLFATDRAHHVESVIRPWLGQGAVVLSDRYVDSSLAYQAGGRDLDEAQVRALSEFATGGLAPDLTVVLDVPVAQGLARARQRGAMNRIDAHDHEFHRRVRRRFLRLAAADPDRYLVVSAVEPEWVVAEVVGEAVGRLLQERQLLGEPLVIRDVRADRYEFR